MQQLSMTKNQLNFFADSEQLGTLPETVYISGFQNSSFTAVADYEEDCDLVSQIDGTTVTGKDSQPGKGNQATD